jgi:fimbrial isopeptide formation D2 family protein
LILTKVGLKKINNLDKDTAVKLTYSALINPAAYRMEPEFHWGHKPSYGNTPLPHKPDGYEEGASLNNQSFKLEENKSATDQKDTIENKNSSYISENREAQTSSMAGNQVKFYNNAQTGIGSIVPYIISTIMPKGASYASMYWDDSFSKGLTFNYDLIMTLDGTPLEKGADYTIDDSDHYFRVNLTKALLDRVNNSENDRRFDINYSATVNENAIVRYREFIEYGHQQKHDKKEGLLDVDLTFDANGGSFKDGDIVKKFTKKPEETIKIIEEPSREGYEFISRKGSDGKEYKPDEDFTVSDDFIFEANWKNDPPELEVTQEKTIKVGEDLDLKSLITKARDNQDGEDLKEKVEVEGEVDNTKPGEYEITYKLTDLAGEYVTKKATVIVEEDSETETPTEPEKEEAILTFKANGGVFSDGSIIKKVVGKIGDFIEIIKAPFRQGYKFDFWKGSQYYPGDKYKITGDHTFEAQWIKEDPEDPGVIPDNKDDEDDKEEPDDKDDENKEEPDNKDDEYKEEPDDKDDEDKEEPDDKDDEYKEEPDDKDDEDKEEPDDKDDEDKEEPDDKDDQDKSTINDNLNHIDDKKNDEKKETINDKLDNIDNNKEDKEKKYQVSTNQNNKTSRSSIPKTGINDLHIYVALLAMASAAYLVLRSKK